VWVGRLQGRASTADLQPDYSGWHSAKWFNNSGPVARSGKQAAMVRLQPGASTVGYLSGTAIGLVTQLHHVVPLTECKVAGDKTRHAHVVEDIICYS
jgi:hypothetical protein